jgi:hypothetical protein
MTMRPSAGECEPHKRVNQKEDPSDFEDKYDPNHHWGHYTLETFRHETAHDVVRYLRGRQPKAASPKRRSQLPPRSLMEQCGGLFDNDKARHTVRHLTDIDGDYLPHTGDGGRL